EVKAITTRCGISYDGPTIPPTSSPLSKEVELEPEATKDKKLSLPDLTPTRMTLELATRSIAYPAGIAEDVFVQVGKFTFPSNFVVVDYDVDPRVPLTLGRPFLRTARALVDVYGEELILRDNDEQLIFHADRTSKHPHKHESINMINFIDITCEDRFPEVLKFKKLNHPSSGSTTPLSDSSPSLTPFETSDSLLEEFDIDSEKDKNKDSKMKSLVVEAHIVKSNDLLPQLLDNDSTLPEDPSESSKIAYLSSSPFRNEDNVFNPRIHILGRTQILKDESKDKDLKDKDLILEDHDFLSISFDQELLFFLELTVIDSLLSFSTKNKDKVFNSGIIISKGVHSFTLRLSHRIYEIFKIINIHSNIFNEGPKKDFSVLLFLPHGQRNSRRVKLETQTKTSASREATRVSILFFYFLAYGNPIS
nr:reverse transcriptase domain-containing protein [Tanacetum cinerariifolium]